MSKAAIKKDLILRSTEELLSTAGGSGLSMRKVADKAGISLGNLQYHFANREALLVGLLSMFVKRYADSLKSTPIARSGDVQEDLHQLFLVSLDSPEFSQDGRIFKELWAEAQHSDVLASALRTYYSDLADFYASVLGALDIPDPSPEKTQNAVSLLMPLIEGYCVTKPMMSWDVNALAKTWSIALAAYLLA